MARNALFSIGPLAGYADIPRLAGGADHAPARSGPAAGGRLLAFSSRRSRGGLDYERREIMSDDPDAIWSELPRSYLLLSAATRLHAAAIDEKADKSNLPALVEDYYRNLCSKILPAVDYHHGLDPDAEKARKDFHAELVFNAEGAEQSTITRNYRYTISLKDIIWPPGEGGICFGSDGKLPKAGLKRALKTLSDERAKAVLRELPIPNAEAEKSAMEFEIARAIRSLKGSPDLQKTLQEMDRRLADAILQLSSRPAEARGDVENGRDEALRRDKKDEQSHGKESEQWSEPDTPSRWARKFGVSVSTIKRYFKNGKIRSIRLSDRRYRVHISDIPAMPSISDRK